MRCPYCGWQNEKGARVCAYCEHRLPKPQRGKTVHRFFRKKSRRILVLFVILLLIMTVLFLLSGKAKDKQDFSASVVDGQLPLLMRVGELTLKVGESGMLVPFDDGWALTYTSSDDAIASVDPTGTVTGQGAGTVVITVTDDKGGQAICPVTVTSTMALTGFTIPEMHARTYGCRLEGQVTSETPLTNIRIEIFSVQDGRLSEEPEVMAEVKWDAGTGPVLYDMNDEEQNLNQLTSFKKLTLGSKQLYVRATNATHTDLCLYSAAFEVYEKKHPYASKLDPDRYPSVAPNQWENWIVWEEDLHHNIDPIFMGRLAAFAQAQGKKLTIVSGFRTRDKQEQLYEDFRKGSGNPANKPGTSWHEFGGAVDVGDWAKNVEESVYKKFGLCKPVDTESWHIQPIETTSMTDKEAFYNAYSAKTYPKWAENAYIKS